MQQMAWRSLRAACQATVRRISLRVEGLEHLPMSGPVVLAARHFHHLWDGCALLTVMPRPLYLVVALDWARNPVGRPLLERACAMAGWPAVVRPAADAGHCDPGPAGGETRRLLAATREVTRLLRRGNAVLIFPEGYPNIDPGYTPKRGDEAFLPFQPGFVRFVALVERGHSMSIPVVPVGLEYRRGPRWALTVRFGAPRYLIKGEPRASLVTAIESDVRRLSGLEGA